MSSKSSQYTHPYVSRPLDVKGALLTSDVQSKVKSVSIARWHFKFFSLLRPEFSKTLANLTSFILCHVHGWVRSPL
jgi:hypothetical protein